MDGIVTKTLRHHMQNCDNVAQKFKEHVLAPAGSIQQFLRSVS